LKAVCWERQIQTGLEDMRVAPAEVNVIWYLHTPLHPIFRLTWGTKEYVHSQAEIVACKPSTSEIDGFRRAYSTSTSEGQISHLILFNDTFYIAFRGLFRA